jgi:RHS repeat-associated protein
MTTNFPAKSSQAIKALCLLIVLSLVGQAFPVTAHEPMAAPSGVPVVQPDRPAAEQVLAPQPLQRLASAAAANEDCFSPVVNKEYRLFLPLIARNASGAAAAAAAGNAPAIPADPGIAAPPLDRSVATDIFQATTFLYSGDNPLQTGVASGAISPKCVAVLRGQVLTGDGQPLAGVTVSIRHHPEYGQTLSRADGLYDLVINGSEVLVSYTKDGYLPVQRAVPARWREHIPIEAVVMTPLDTHVTTINLTSATHIQVTRGSAISDADGQRQATLLFSPSTQAVITLTNGTTQTLSTLNVRATEYTVGERGIQAMPGNLPALSGYTYAVEFSVDEADAAGAVEVRFDQAVINYTENFIHAPVGSPVPTGYYDRAQGKWIPSKNGRVIRILSETAGMADVDVTGDGVADTGAALAALDITDAEREQLANLYNAGQELWRVAITHFTPWDHNWPYGPPPGAQPPKLKWFNNEEPDPCWTKGSIINCETQTLGEAISLVGTPFSLVYQSDRVPGYEVGRTLDIPVTGSPLPPLLKGVRLQIEIAGRTFEQRWEDPTSPISSTTPYPPIVPNLNYHFVWDGLDAYGRLMQGRPVATIRVMYIYDFIYYGASSAFDASFAQFGDNVQLFDGRYACREVVSRFFCGIPIEQTVYRTLGPWDVTPIDGLGGWTLNVHHSYDPAEQVVHKGDGSLIRAETLGALYTTIAGGGSKGFPAAEGGSALVANIDSVGDVAVGLDGSVYFYHGLNNNNHIRKIDPNGIVTTYAGNGLKGDPTGDGGPALQATLGHFVNAIAAGPDGSLYLAVQANIWPRGFIRKIDPNGSITTIAGNGQGAGGGIGDGGLATNARVSDPIDVIVAPDGSIYFNERATPINNNKARVRRIDLNGVIHTVAGGGVDATRDEDLGNGEPANKHDIKLPYHLAFGTDGSLYIPDPTEHVVKRVTPDGIIRRFAGDRFKGYMYSGDGGPAVQAGIGDPVNVAVSSEGVVYIRERHTYDHIRKVTPDGIITAYAGKEDCGYAWSPSGTAAQQACIFTNSAGLEVHPDGSLIVGDGRYLIRRIALPQTGFSANALLIPSPDGAELYEFSSVGRHLRTFDGLTGALRYQFAYDAAGRLSNVIDANGRVTHIERTGNGTPTAIVAPNGQRTSLTLNNAGYLNTTSNPAGETTSLAYRPGSGLLATLVDSRGDVHNFVYDWLGRLISDQGPSGEIKTLTRSQIQGLVVVTVTTGLKRSTIYATEVLSTGDRLRTVTTPDGSKTSLWVGQNGVRVLQEPNGTRTTLTLGPDPRWGMRVPIAASEIITMPGGLRRETLTTRTVILTDAQNPMSLETLTNRVTVNGRQSTTTYDALAHTIRRQSAQDRSSVTTLDTLGRVVSIVPDYALTPITFNYDAQGRLIKLQQGALAITSTFDALNRLIASTNASGAMTQYGYDAANRVTALTLPGGSTYGFTYDANGNRTGVLMPNGATHVLSYTASNADGGYNPPGSGELSKAYDLDGALNQRLLPDGRAVDTIYGTDGRPATEIYDEAGITFGFDSTSNMFNTLVRTPASINLGSPQTTTLLYAGSLLTRTDAVGAATGQYTYTYDNNLFLTKINLQSGLDVSAISLTRDKDGWVTGYGPFTIGRAGPDGAQSAIGDGTLNLTLAYNSLAQRIQRHLMLNGLTVYKSQLSYDKAGNITQNIETVSGISHTLTYNYDADGQLAQVRRDGALIESYGYDTNGNRTSAQLAASPTVFATYDIQDRIISQGNVNYQFNAAGQLTQRGADIFFYSARSELLQATVNGQTITYSYDALRRRVARSDAAGTYQYLYGNPGNPFWITAMRDPAGQLTTYYYDDEGMLFAFQRGVNRYYVATDQVGTPRVVVNSGGAIVKRLDYDSFGNLTGDSAPGFELPIGFAGGLSDAATGLVHFGYRDYDPAAGRWTVRDPARYDGGQFNLYAYVQNDPVQLRDPAGLGWGISGSLFAGIGIEAEIMVSDQGISSCFGVGVGMGTSLGVKSGNIKKRSGLYTSGELSGKYGPLGVSTGFEIDPCGNLTQNPGKFTAGPLSVTDKGDVQGSLDPKTYTQEAAGSTELKLQGKLTGKYCTTTLD